MNNTLKGARAVNKVQSVLEYLLKEGLISDEAASTLILEVEDARSELVQAATDLTDAQLDLVERSKSDSQHAEVRFYGSLDEYAKGEIFLAARRNGFHSAFDFIRSTQGN